MTNLSCCHFPSTILLVDDNIDFLSTLSLLVDKHIPIKFETDPKNALTILENEYLKPDFIQNCFYSLKVEDFELCDPTIPVNLLNVSKLQNLKNRKDRFASISLLLVDYSMPQMSGKELCQKLRHIPIKKAMITGEADLNVAVDAFNEGIIDRFITKNSVNFKQEVQKTIAELQEKFFLDISRPLIDRLKTSENIWENNVFYNFIKQKQVELNALEYYLLDIYGSFIFIDAEGNSAILAVKSLDNIKHDYHTAVDNDATSDIIFKLANKTHFPFFLTEKNLKLPTALWGRLIHEAKPIPGMHETFYAIIDSVNINEHYESGKCYGINDYLNDFK